MHRIRNRYRAFRSVIQMGLQYPVLIKAMGGAESAARRLYELQEAIEQAQAEARSQSTPPSRTEIINALAAARAATRYLEVGVRNPDDNFKKINCRLKHSVDPGLEYEDNPVDFAMTSDEFFSQDAPTSVDYYDVIFIDGLHLSSQVDRDIRNAVRATREGGVVVLHDCLPPSHSFARECFAERFTPSGDAWNGTTWKAFWRFAFESEYSCYCVPSDYGVGIIDTRHRKNATIYPDPFFEFASLHDIAQESGLLMPLEEVIKNVEHGSLR